MTTLRTEMEQTRASAEFLRQGINLYHQRRYAEAIAAYTQAIALDPKNAILFDLRGYAYLLERNVTNAVGDLKKAVELNADYPWGRYNLALAYWAADKQDAAVDQLETLLQREPSFLEVIKRDSQFRRFQTSARFRELTSGT